MKNFISIILVFFVLLSFSSCNNDDERTYKAYEGRWNGVGINAQYSAYTWDDLDNESKRTLVSRDDNSILYFQIWPKGNNEVSVWTSLFTDWVINASDTELNYVSINSNSSQQKKEAKVKGFISTSGLLHFTRVCKTEVKDSVYILDSMYYQCTLESRE